MADALASRLRGDFLAQLLHVGDAAHRLLAMQDCDPRSPSHGSFHYPYWRDKTSEFADARFQEAGAALGLLAHPAFADTGRSRGWPGSDVMLDAFHAGLVNLQRLQYRAGCYDEWYKGERGFAATAFSTFAYAGATLHLGSTLTSESRALVREVLKPAAVWLEKHDDMVKTNHEMVAAAALAAFHKITGDPRWRDAASAKMDRSLAAQTPEGWFPELTGMDFGYSALALDYLMQYQKMTGEGRAIGAASRLVQFLLPHLHPDLSLSAEGGTCRNGYGGQSGYLLLARHDSTAHAITARLLALSDSRPRILDCLADDLRLARWSVLPIIAALDLLNEGADIAPVAALPYPQGWTVHASAAVAAYHRDECHVYFPFAGGPVTRIYSGDEIRLTDLGVDALNDGVAFTALSYSADRVAERSGNSVSVAFDAGRAKYFRPGSVKRLLLRLASATETGSRLTRALIDRYRCFAKTAINQSATFVSDGRAAIRVVRTVGAETGHIVVVDRLTGAKGATLEFRLLPVPCGQACDANSIDGPLTIRKTVDLQTGRLLVQKS